MCSSSQKKASKMLGIHRSIKSKTRPALGCYAGSLHACALYAVFRERHVDSGKAAQGAKGWGGCLWRE